VIPGPCLSGGGWVSLGLGGGVLPSLCLSGAGWASVGPGLGLGPLLARAAPRSPARGEGVCLSLDGGVRRSLARGGEMRLALARGVDVVPGRAAAGPVGGVGAGLGEFAGWRPPAVPSSWPWWPSSWHWACLAVTGQCTSW
jgi:hypothetical protein